MREVTGPLSTVVRAARANEAVHDGAFGADDESRRAEGMCQHDKLEYSRQANGFQVNLCLA